MIKVDIMEKVLWNIQMVASFKEFMFVECLQKEYLNIPMATFIKVNWKIINPMEKVNGLHKKDFLKELLVTEIL